MCPDGKAPNEDRHNFPRAFWGNAYTLLHGIPIHTCTCMNTKIASAHAGGHVCLSYIIVSAGMTIEQRWRGMTHGHKRSLDSPGLHRSASRTSCSAPFAAASTTWRLVREAASSTGWPVLSSVTFSIAACISIGMYQNGITSRQRCSL